MSRPRISAVTTILILTSLQVVAQDPVREAYERAERFGSPEMARLVRGASVQPHWIGDGPRFWYLNQFGDEREFILVDPEKAERKPAFDHERLAGALSKATGTKHDGRKLPFSSIVFDAGRRALVFRAGSQWWRCDLTTYECASTEAPKTDTRPDRQPTRRRQAPERQPGVSPDGKMRVEVRNHNLFLRELPDGLETPLTTDGVPENRYGEPRWSPNSRYVVALRTQPGELLPMYAIESTPLDSLRPKLRQYGYALPGDKLDVHEMWVFDTQLKKAAKVETDPIDSAGMPDLRWKPDGKRFTYEQPYRAFRRERVVEVNAATGSARAIIDETTTTFVYPPVRFIHYLDSTSEILWTSQRDGWNHIYLFDAETGEVKSRVTSGEWVVRRIEKVDEQARQILFAASGREPDRDPYLLHYYHVNFDGSGLICLTPGDGEHSIRFSPDGEYYLDTYSRVDLPPITELRRTSDGSLVCELEKADASALLATGWRMPEPFVAKGRDGKTDIWGVIFRPSNFDPERKYPVIEDIYAGPQGAFVPKTFSAQRGMQGLAELGFIVVKIDGMGTANRSKAFHDVAYKNLGDSGFPDRILWMKAAAEKYPYMDLTRVGIYGSSAGGYNAARALIAHPEFYKVAVAMSGNHDHRTDKVWWNELWMGYPVGPHYAEQSNVEQAAKLQGKLLLVHGELDDNVNPSAATMRFADALIKANKDFDMLIVPGAGHGFGPYVTRRMWDFFVRHLLGVEPPHEYVMKGPADSSCEIVIRNLLDKAVTVYWVEGAGSLRKYHDLAPGQEVRQHSYVGHEWEAHVDGRAVSWYTVSASTPEWDIAPGG